MCPAYFSDHELKERKKYQAEFTGFDASHSMIKTLEVLSMHNPKNAYRQSDSKIIVEYEQEADLFNACEHAIYFSSYKVVGTPRDYSCWIYNKKPLVKSPVVLPTHHEPSKNPAPKQEVHQTLVNPISCNGANSAAADLDNSKDLEPSVIIQPNEESAHAHTHVHPDRLRNFI